MAVRTRIEPLDRDIALIIDQELSPKAQSAALASYARDELAAAQAVNQRSLGMVPPHDTFVDGRREAPLESVRPDGVIVFEFELVTDAIEWIEAQLLKHSPIRSGQFRKSHRLFADGQEVQFGADVPPAREYEFVNLQPYARKIERGLSKQAPDGVFEAVAVLAQRRFGNVARIRFTYREPIYGAIHAWANKRQNSMTRKQRSAARRQPAIVMTVN